MTINSGAFVAYHDQTSFAFILVITEARGPNKIWQERKKDN